MEAALICQRSGADSIVAHLREDRRHIQDTDVFRLREKIMIKLNLEMANEASVIETALKAHPPHHIEPGTGAPRWIIAGWWHFLTVVLNSRC